jgi:hypothetical protein
MTAATREIGIGAILGLYDCRDFSEYGTVLAYADDYAADEAHGVIQRLSKIGIQLHEQELDVLTPDWKSR